MINLDKIKAMEELLSKLSEADIAELLQKDGAKVNEWSLPFKPIPFRCPICLQESMKIIEVEKSELDATEVAPYAMFCLSSIWTFACGHTVKRVSEINVHIEKEEKEEDNEEELA